jgi:hypothetical protein
MYPLPATQLVVEDRAEIVVQGFNRSCSISWAISCAAIVCLRAVASISDPIVIAVIIPMNPTTRITDAIMTSTMVNAFEGFDRLTTGKLRAGLGDLLGTARGACFDGRKIKRL